MQRYKIIISYDGTDFQGWQHQPHKKTVANCLEMTYEKIFNEKISIVGASRTDSGVHAIGQVASFKSNTSCNKIAYAWNNLLPNSIQIKTIEQVNDDFFPLRNVKEKTYFYNLFLKQPSPFNVRYGWFYQYIHRLDLQKLKAALKIYEGTHDFRSFCKLEEDKNTIRTINEINMKQIDDTITDSSVRITLKSSGFLRFQIRRMIGYAVEIACRKDFHIQYIQEMLNNPSPQQTLIRAPAKGLFLEKITYGG